MRTSSHSTILYLPTSNRPVVHTAVADLFHNIKGDLAVEQLAHIVHVYSSFLFNMSMGLNLHILFAKVLFGLTETIVGKDTSQQAAKLIRSMFETCLERLEGLCAIQREVNTALEKSRAGTQDAAVDAFFIEKSRPVQGALYALEKPEDVMLGTSATHVKPSCMEDG